jgi:hypothetical protein
MNLSRATRRDKRATTKILLMATTAAVALSAFAFRPALATFATTGTSFTSSLAAVDTIIDTPVTQQVNNFSTELIAQMQGGPVLYDQTFPVPFADPAFQSAVGTAESVLTSNGAASFIGPTLVLSTNTSSSSTQTVQTGSTSNLSVLTTLYIGPQTINIGNYGVCQSYPPPVGCTIGGTPFTLAAGQVDFDTFTVNRVNIFTTTTTTNTDLLTQVYDLVGVPASTVPEPPAWTLLGAGLLGLGFIFRQRIKDRAHPPSGTAAS